MKKSIEHYNGYEITKEVIAKINLIALKRYQEDRYSICYEEYDTLEEICDLSNSSPKQINIILGEDWYIIYSKREYFVEIIEWISKDTVTNKLEQTMEMFYALKNILLSVEGKNLTATMKHNTSYKFYTSFLKRGFLEEFYDDIDTETDMPSDIKKVKDDLENKYGSIEYFLEDENRDKEQEEILEDYIYHEVIFGITDKFVKRYKKQENKL